MTLQLGPSSKNQDREDAPLIQQAFQRETFRNLAAEATSSKVKRYYKNLVEILDHFEQDQAIVQDFRQKDSAKAEALEKTAVGHDIVKRALFLAKLSLYFNTSLLVAKTVASILSHSFSIITSAIDSATDIATGLIILLSSRAIRRRDPHVYPRGRSPLEPLAFVFISFIMGCASVQISAKSIEAIILKSVKPDVRLPTILIMLTTIVIKVVLCVMCYLCKSAQTNVLAQDHRNDCLSNAVAIVCAYLGDRFWKQIDPIGAVLVSLYLIILWMKTGFEQVRILSGRSADPQLISRIIRISLDHSVRFDRVDTVYAYHIGSKVLVEVHVVMDKNTSLREAHDVAEPLQCKLERLPEVEGAFVHVDYEVDHRPEYEHKIV